jgi:hypothetical protein
VNTGDTVNTSQADKPTSFGSNSQNIDPDEGITFTFVTGANPEFTVSPVEPRLTQTEAKVEANIQFSDVVDAKGGSFFVVKFTGGTTAELKLTAYETEANPGVDYIDGDGLTGNIGTVNILEDSVEVIKGAGNTTDIGVIYNDDGTAIITGLEDGDQIFYLTDGPHNRLFMENPATSTGASYNIGGFELVEGDTTTQEVGSTVFWEDDGPENPTVELSGAEPIALTFDGGLSDGNFVGTEGAGDTNPSSTIATVDFASAFTIGNLNDYGADGAGASTVTYALQFAAGFTEGSASGLTTGSSPISLYENGGVITGSTGGRRGCGCHQHRLHPL